MRDLLDTLAGNHLSSTAKLIAILEAEGFPRSDIEGWVGCSGATYRRAKAALKNERFARSKMSAALKNEHPERSKMSGASRGVSLPTEVFIPGEVNNQVSTPYSPPNGSGCAATGSTAAASPSPIQKLDPDGVRFDGRVISLDAGNRGFWLEQFGGDAPALDLALIEAAAAIQPNARQLLAVQVARPLARIARETRERARRYAKAAAAKTVPGAPKGGLAAALEKSRLARQEVHA